MPVSQTWCKVKSRSKQKRPPWNDDFAGIPTEIEEEEDRKSSPPSRRRPKPKQQWNNDFTEGSWNNDFTEENSPSMSSNSRRHVTEKNTSQQHQSRVGRERRRDVRQQSGREDRVGRERRRDVRQQSGREERRTTQNRQQRQKNIRKNSKTQRSRSNAAAAGNRKSRNVKERTSRITEEDDRPLDVGKSSMMSAYPSESTELRECPVVIVHSIP